MATFCSGLRVSTIDLGERVLAGELRPLCYHWWKEWHSYWPWFSGSRELTSRSWFRVIAVALNFC